MLVALGTQDSKGMRHMSSVPYPALQNFSTLYHKRHDFRIKRVNEHEMRVLIFSTTFVCNSSRSKKMSGVRSKTSSGLFVKYPLFLSGFKETLILLSFSKNTQISIFMKNRPVGAEFYADRRTDGYDEANSRFSQFCERA